MSTPDRSDASIFKELMAGIDSAYKEVDTVFHDNGLDTKESSFNDAEMHEGADGVYMKIFASKVLPFDVASTGTAAWRYFSRSLEHIPFRFLYHKDLQVSLADVVNLTASPIVSCSRLTSPRRVYSFLCLSYRTWRRQMTPSSRASVWSCMRRAPRRITV